MPFLLLDRFVELRLSEVLSLLLVIYFVETLLLDPKFLRTSV